MSDCRDPLELKTVVRMIVKEEMGRKNQSHQEMKSQSLDDYSCK